jgi:GT2 family glycosyltransferase
MGSDDVRRTARVAVVVLSYNGLADTVACVESLKRVRWDPLTTLVVDNGSTDGSADAVAERFPDAPLIRCEENLGFAEGNNVGLRAAFEELGADYALLLNNDTLADERLVAALVEEAERHPDAGALSPMIYYTDPPDLIWYAGARFDPRRGHNGRHTGYGERDRGQYDAVREIARATGAAVLVPRAVVEDVGYLDGDLFLQVEDVEWSLRMREAGYRVLFVPAAKVWHRVSVATGGEHSPATAYYEMRNTLEVSQRYAPMRGWSALNRHLTILAVQLFHARRAQRPLENVRAALEGWRDYRAGRLGPRGAAETAPPSPRLARRDPRPA